MSRKTFQGLSRSSGPPRKKNIFALFLVFCNVEMVASLTWTQEWPCAILFGCKKRWTILCRAVFWLNRNHRTEIERRKTWRYLSIRSAAVGCYSFNLIFKSLIGPFPAELLPKSSRNSFFQWSFCENIYCLVSKLRTGWVYEEYRKPELNCPSPTIMLLKLIAGIHYIIGV